VYLYKEEARAFVEWIWLDVGYFTHGLGYLNPVLFVDLKNASSVKVPIV
jgi:hypothetical protein